jgi:YfiH family protein
MKLSPTKKVQMTESINRQATIDLQIEPLRSQLLSTVPGIVHGITHRVEGMGKADGNVGYSTPRDKDDAWKMRQLWCEAIGVDARNMVLVGQLHEADVFQALPEHAGAGASPDRPQAGYADAIMTDHPNVVVTTLHADCLPIFLVDAERPAVAAVHAGWRGTVADIAGATVRAMQEAYDSDPANILAFLGPGIGPCCNEVGPEVTAAWRDQAKDLGPLAEVAVTIPSVREHLDIPRANALLLQRAGLQPEHIEISPICTKCSLDDWFSHRGQGPATGRQAAMIMLTGTERTS